MKLEPSFTFTLFELVNREAKKTTTATGTSLNKRFNEQYNRCARALEFLVHLFAVLSGPVHTNPFSNENGVVLLRIRLSSTLQRRKRSPKTEPFENALQSGATWNRCFLKTLLSSVDGENGTIWKRWRHQNRHDRAPDHSTVSIQNGGRHYQVASLLIGVEVWTGENDTITISVDTNLFENGAKQLRFLLKTD